MLTLFYIILEKYNNYSGDIFDDNNRKPGFKYVSWKKIRNHYS